jgi:hypothetical protein
LEFFGLEMKMCLVIPTGYIAKSLALTPNGLEVGETTCNGLFDIRWFARRSRSAAVPANLVRVCRYPGLIFRRRGLRCSLVKTAEDQ